MARAKLARMKRALIFFLALLVVAGGIVGAVLAKSHSDQVTLPSREVDTFLHAWGRDDPADMATLVAGAPANFATLASSLVHAVSGSTASYTRTGLVGTADTANATYRATVVLKGVGTVHWNGALALAHGPAGWLISWSPTILYPGLGANQRLSVSRTWPARAPILATDGSVLAGSEAFVWVGLEPDHIQTPADLAAVKASMKAVLLVDGPAIDAALHAPGVRPNQFVRVVKVPKDPNYQHIHDTLFPIRGIEFRDAQGVTSADNLLAQQIVGNVGDVTAEGLTKLGAPYTAGDQVGLSGLEATYEKRLAGTPSTDVVVVASDGSTIHTVQHFAGKAAQPVQLSIDPATQRAAEAALAGVTKNAALVAVDASTGAIRAVVSKPDNGFPRALSGTYPPGSTFKVVTSTALLIAGSNGATPAPCPKELTVDGQTFRNFEGESPGALDLATAFKISCNNAFIGLADKLPANALSQAAALYGFNTHWTLGINAAGGSYPAPKDPAERAASAIGQGRVLASPLQMATVAAAVDAGQWRQPVLVTQPATSRTAAAPALTPAVDATLKSFMKSVLEAGGTAAGAGLPADSFGKTGTAEFGPNSSQEHAWYIGFRGNLAFAVIVEGGGVGGAVAAPLAAGFLRTAPH